MPLAQIVCTTGINNKLNGLLLLHATRADCLSCMVMPLSIMAFFCSMPLARIVWGELLDEMDALDLLLHATRADCLHGL